MPCSCEPVTDNNKRRQTNERRASAPAEPGHRHYRMSENAKAIAEELQYQMRQGKSFGEVVNEAMTAHYNYDGVSAESMWALKDEEWLEALVKMRRMPTCTVVSHQGTTKPKATWLVVSFSGGTPRHYVCEGHIGWAVQDVQMMNPHVPIQVEPLQKRHIR